MSYKETRKLCKACGRETVHWRPWNEWRENDPAYGIQIPIRAVLRVVRKIYLPPWRCLECDHPWFSSLLGRRSKRR
ncbi:MAG TPA: hypothetical protein VGZ22_07310 [Isosphaeraceae bacterium]|jgi:hypothetical protein|nr:hypothetical protein [Isosphaeraceae bacterium]